MPEPTPESTPPDGRQRLLEALKRPVSRGQLVAAVLLAGLGFAGVAQVQSNEADDQYVGTRQADLIALINQLTLASERAENEIVQLEQTRDSLRNDTDSRQTAIRRAEDEANTLGILAGVLAVQGPGIRVTVKDPAGGIGTDQLLNGIEELRDAGAEAIEFNNSVRVVARTAIQDGPNGGVLIDGQQLEPPYTIEAIGDSHTLATALDFAGGFVFGVEQVPDASVEIARVDDVDIGSVVAPESPDFADPQPTE